MIELRVLGGALLSRDGVAVHGGAAQRHHVALLAVLGVSPGHRTSRDKLVAHFWPESDTPKARHRLRVALHVIRRELGHDCLITSSDNVRLNSELVWADVGAFVESVSSGRLGEAVELYRGAFLDGFFLAGLPEFERWVDGERTRLGVLYRTALERLIAEAEARGDRSTAVRWWERLALHDPYGAPTALGVVRALAAVGDIAGAVRYARAYAVLIQAELGLSPDPEVLRLAEELVRQARERGESKVSPPLDDPRPLAEGATACPRGSHHLGDLLAHTRCGHHCGGDGSGAPRRILGLLNAEKVDAAARRRAWPERAAFRRRIEAVISSPSVSARYDGKRTLTDGFVVTRASEQPAPTVPS